MTRVFMWRRSRTRARGPLRLELPKPLRNLAQAALSSWVATALGAFALAAVLLGINHLVGSWELWISLLLLTLVVGLVALAWVGGVHRWLSRRPRVLTLRRAGARAVERANLAGAWVTLLEPADVAALVRTANRLHTRVWWLPTGLYAGLAGLKGRRITTFADFVPAEFPQMLLDDPEFADRGEAMARCLESSDAIICLSEHVRSRHLPALVPSIRGIATVVSPGPPVRAMDVAAGRDRRSTLAALSDGLREEHPGSVARNRGWWSEPVLIAPTQSRSYKNLRALIRAVQIVNVQHHVRVRLILTTHPGYGHLGDFVREHRCRAFVEFLPELSDANLDLALAAADLAITPSLFEGSLPYTLFESVRVDTPCLMADIPVTREATEGFDSFREATLFDPHEPTAIAQRIRQSLDALPDMLDVQRAFVADYYARTSWEHVAHRYWDVIDQVRGGA